MHQIPRLGLDLSSIEEVDGASRHDGAKRERAGDCFRAWVAR